MQFGKALLLIAFTAVHCIAYVHTLHCYVCRNVIDCQSPQTVLCTEDEAKLTVEYLSENYMGVDVQHISAAYDCFSDYLNASAVQRQFKGCANGIQRIFRTTKQCGYAPVEAHHPSDYSCEYCSGDYCNSAARTELQLWHAFIMIAFAVAAQFVRKYTYDEKHGI